LAGLKEEFGWETSASRRNKSRLSLFFALLLTSTPSYLRIRIVVHPPVRQTGANACREMIIAVPQCRLECYKSSFFPSTSRLWSTLAVNIVNSLSKPEFKTLLKIHFNLTPPPCSPDGAPTRISALVASVE